jgi:hypothetical protein
MIESSKRVDAQDYKFLKESELGLAVLMSASPSLS